MIVIETSTPPTQKFENITFFLCVGGIQIWIRILFGLNLNQPTHIFFLRGRHQFRNLNIEE